MSASFRLCATLFVDNLQTARQLQKAVVNRQDNNSLWRMLSFGVQAASFVDAVTAAV
jgi:hypothetical protein